MATMTRIERKILSNQFTILEHLLPDQGYGRLREIVENGYEIEYSDVLQDIYDGNEHHDGG
jgi:uncharacterized protein YfbU (UPF0304 family)